jgi:hypothetical protein
VIDRIILCHQKRQTYTRLSVSHMALTIEEGTIKPRGVFNPITCERFSFADYPELMALHDGNGWNIPEVMLLVSDWKPPLPDEVHVILGRCDMDLLLKQGLEIA